MFVESRMTANPITISSNTTIADASEIMRNNKFRRLPVVEGGKLVGIVTDRDLRAVSASPATALSIFELNYLLAKMKIKDIMQKEVISINTGATVEEAAILMYNHRIGGLVVVDEQGAVAGIITETDIFKSFVDIMGLVDGKTRLTLDVTDKIGLLHEISEVFLAMNINITSMVSYALPDGKIEMIIRADIIDTEELEKALAAKGYPISHVVHIKS
ncbi:MULTISPECIES: CBS domain-containing protein [Pelosinus]|uniref:Transcriptional regulator, Rrf2 family n=2 Tax=Pelosinus TaxID=365348 RepID=I9NTX4_9FIRM|nr:MULTISPECIES: CBS and ACT domain-containing protein [Pelosinus]AJQ30066.1 transcriptional regulator, Rrf2 family [Pelosinus fermentans JBW45]MCC5468195.1 CBS and ACT domain-containing protein [Pelosinus baikalensis]